MIKLLFWAFVVVDVAVIGLVFLLGLAAAGSSRSGGAPVVLLMGVLPLALIVASIWVFHRSPSTLVRTIAFVLVAAPLVVAVASKGLIDATIRANMNEKGELTFFRRGKERDLVEAIRRDDSAAVAALVKTADVNASGLGGMTPLVEAMRALRSETTDPAVLSLLLAAHADPNRSAIDEYPLEIALQESQRLGVKPIEMLLAAGADPNRRNAWGTPLFFGSAGLGVSRDALPLLLRHGIDVNATSKSGETILTYAAMARNWRAVKLLLARGADGTLGRTSMGKSFMQLVDEFERERASRGGDGEIRPEELEGFDDVRQSLGKR